MLKGYKKICWPLCRNILEVVNQLFVSIVTNLDILRRSALHGRTSRIKMDLVATIKPMSCSSWQRCWVSRMLDLPEVVLRKEHSRTFQKGVILMVVRLLSQKTDSEQFLTVWKLSIFGVEW